MCKERKVFLDNLPRWEKGGRAKEGTINWTESIGYKVKFIYDDIEGEIEIISYDVKKHNLYIKYLDKKPFKINTGNLGKCQLGELLETYTGNFKIEIGVKFIDNKRDLIIIDRKIIKDKNDQNRKVYKYKCNKCGFECGEHYKNGEYKEELWISENNLLRGNGCACCCPSPQVVVKGINDMPTTAPFMVKYFQGGYDEAKKYTKASGEKIYPICPDCGRVKSKTMKISDIYRKYSIGCSCGDGLSYPEKLMYSVLEQLKVNFIYQYNPHWCEFKFQNKNKKGRYDFYFELNSKKYIIEMDGGFHYKNNKMNGQTKEESQYIDDAKDNLAEKHDIEVIRIDSIVSELEYIKNNILIKLNNLFDLSNINWNQAEEYALSNLVKKCCEIKRDNPNMSTLEISKVLKVSRTIIIDYLKRGAKIWGWCNYNPKEESGKVGKMKSKPIEIFRDGNSLGIFESCAELERQGEKLFGVKLNYKNISQVCNGKKKIHKGFTFNYIS